MQRNWLRVAGVWASILLVTAAVGQPVEWIEQFGSQAHDWPTNLASDSEGGVFVAGYTLGSLGGPNSGADDAFLARYDEAGVQHWLKQFGTTGSDQAMALASDGAGGVFVTGYTFGSMDGQNAGGSDIFLARYDADGARMWIRQVGTNASDTATAICPDGEGGVFVTGATGGNFGGNNAGSTDGFLVRYSAAGFPAWIVQFGSSAEDYPNGLAPDGAGGVFVEGYTLGSLGGNHAGDLDVFLGRFDGDGEQNWMKQFGTNAYDRGNAIASDDSGGVFIVGYTTGSLGGPNAGSDDIFLTRYSGGGDQLWIRQFGTGSSDFTTGLGPDGAGGVYWGGGTWGVLGEKNLGQVDALAGRYDGDGNQIWISQFGTDEREFTNAVWPDAQGGAYVTGYTWGSLGGPNAGGEDAFLVRFGGEICFPSDCDDSGSLNIFDFLCFVNKFNDNDPYADCTGDGLLDLFDFLCFVNAFNNGC